MSEKYPKTASFQPMMNGNNFFLINFILICLLIHNIRTNLLNFVEGRKEFFAKMDCTQELLNDSSWIICQPKQIGKLLQPPPTRSHLAQENYSNMVSKRIRQNIVKFVKKNIGNIRHIEL